MQPAIASWSLGPFTFLNPIFFAGMLAALIPLLIHLSQSKRTKKMRFSTTRFFTDQFLRSYRMSRLKELLLLAFRLALFAFFAMALTQPLFQPKGPTPLVGGEGSRSVVLVLDNSASMGYTENGVTLLDRAREAARTTIDGLRSGDTASVVLAGRRAAGPEVLFETPTDELNDVRQAVDRLQASALGTDLTAAIDQAEKMALAAPGAHREVYVFSDLQRSGWGASADMTARSDTSEVSFVFVCVRPQKAVANAGVTAVQFASARPMVGVPFAIRPLLSITGEEIETVTVRLFVDGEKVGEQRVEKLQSGRWAVPRFHHTFPTGGWHSGYVEVDDANLPQDNRRYFALEVLENVKILAVNGAPSQVPRLDELFFLKLALTASLEGQKSPIDVDTVAPGTVAATDLSKYPLVILANVESLSEAAVAKLEEYAAGGGSLLFFLGDKVNADFYKETLAGSNRRFGGLLPARLERVEGNPAEAKDAAFVRGVRYEHPALTAFQDPKLGSLLGQSVAFKALWRVQAEPETVLMKTNTDAPLLCEKEYGKGRVMLFTSTCDRDWTNFPIRPAFLPWTHRLVAYLAQEPMGHQAFHKSGDVVWLNPVGDPNAPVLVKKPNDALAGATVSDEEAGALVFTDTDQTGVYKVLTADQSGVAAMFAVNLESYESYLHYPGDKLYFEGLADDQPADTAAEVKPVAPEEGLKKKINRPLVTFVDDPTRVGDSFTTARRGMKLWDYVLLVVLAIGLFEPWLANRISARHYSRPREGPALAGPRQPRGQRLVVERSPEPATEEVGPR